MPRSPDTEKGQQSRDQYLACAQVVLHDTKMSYADLYNRYASENAQVPESVMAVLQEGPYARFQRDMKQVDAETLEQYARGTVAQVPSIQSLKPG